MITTYEEFKDHLRDMIKLRAQNYAETDCDINALMYTVYEDIQNKVLLEIARQPHVVTEDIEFEIRDNNAPVQYDNTGNPVYNDSLATEKYLHVLDIVDDCDKSIIHLLHKTDEGKWRWNTCNGCEEPTAPDCYVGKTIYFIRKKVTRLDDMDQEIYGRILNAMLEGMMYYIQTAIPSGIDTQVGNLSYQRYYNAIKEIKNTYPQMVYFNRENTKWL